MVTKQRWCVAYGLFMIIFGIGCMVLASLIVNVVEDQIEEGVKEAFRLQRDFNDWDASDESDWINTDINFTFHMFNITNLLAIQTDPVTLPALDEVSYRATEFDTKFNSAWSSDGTLYSWNWWWKVLWDDSDQPAETDFVYSLNPAYAGALGAIKNITGWRPCAVASGEPWGPTWDGCDVTPAEYPSDVSCCQTERHLLLSLGAPTFAFVSTLYLNENGDFLSGTKTSAVPDYWQAVNNSVHAVVPSFDEITAWVQFDAATLAASGIPPAWGLQAGGVDVTGVSLTEAAQLWNAAFPQSFLNDGATTGLNLWLAAADNRALTASTTPTAADRAGAQQGLQALICGSPTTACTLYVAARSWVQALRDSTSAVGESFMNSTVTTFNTACGSNLTDWTDLGACQFARSILLPTILPSSVLSPIAAVHPSFTGFELSRFNGSAVWTQHFTAALAKKFLTYWSDTSNYNNIFALTNPPNCGALDFLTSSPVSRNCVEAYGGTALLHAPDFDSSSLKDYQWGSNGFFDVTGDSSLNDFNRILVDYLVFYVPYAGFVSNALGANSGAFTKRSPADILFGYTRPNDIAPSLRASDPNNDPLLAAANLTYDGLVSNYSGEDDVLARQNQRPYQIYTGVPDFTRVRQFGAWRGVSTFQTKGDFAVPGTCFDDLPVGGSNTADCAAKVYDNSVSLELTSTGGQFQPFQEDADPKTRQLRIWVPEVRRVVTFVYKTTVTVKGILAHRYVLKDSEILNQTSNPDNAQYHMNDPDGIVDMHVWNNDGPLVVSRPHFLKADERLASRFGGLNPEEELHDTFFDVEPLTGAAINGHKRLQTNVRLDVGRFNLPYMAFVMSRAIDWGDNRSAIYWPAYWTDEEAIITDDDAETFRNSIYDNRELAEWAEVSGYMVGGLSWFIAAVVLLYWLHPTLRVNAQDRKGSSWVGSSGGGLGQADSVELQGLGTTSTSGYQPYTPIKT